MRAGLAALTLAAALAHGAEASAYCRTSVCGEQNQEYTGAQCDPPLPDDCGTRLMWPTPCMTFSVQEDASAQVSYEDAVATFEAAFATWMDADCGEGTHPRLEVTNAGAVSCTEHEFNQAEGKGNANAVVFRDDGWPHEGASHTLALTTVTYSLESGYIYDADLEINSAEHTFTIGDDDVMFDLLSVVTHEVGHFLGMSHSESDPEATMAARYTQGSTALRDLTEDDTAGICAAYPPGEIAACDPAPRNGFSPLCEDEQTAAEDDSGCHVGSTGSGAGGRGFGSAALAALGLLGVALRRRAGRR